MASSYHQHLNSSTPRGYSKSQMCLFKILHIISSIPPSKEEPFPTNNKGVGVDLNLRFCSIEESGEPESSAETPTNAINQRNKNNEGEEEEEVEVEVEVEEGHEDKSGDTQVQSFEVNNNNGVDQVESESEEGGEENVDATETSSFRRNSNCLDLLIEAARVLSGKNESDSEEERGVGGELRTRGASRGVKKRKERWVVVDLYGDMVEEREPVVRSKRGRNQALPYRFRDSVVEPLKRSGRLQRPSSTPTVRKRLLR